MRPARSRARTAPAHRAACAWLILRHIDTDATFEFVDDDIPDGATAFDMVGVSLSHHGDNCTFETMLHAYDLADPVLWDVARIVHEADLADLIQLLRADQREPLIELLGHDFNAAALSELDENVRDQVLEAMPPEKVAEALEQPFLLAL